MQQRRSRRIIGEAPAPSPEETRALEVAANYIERWARWQLKQAVNGPYFAGARSGKLGVEPRARFRMLAALVKHFYGQAMPSTTATMTSVALGTTISKHSADRWCDDLMPALWAIQTDETRR